MTHLNFITACWWVFILVFVFAAFSTKPTKERQHWGGRLATIGFVALTFALLNGAVAWWGLNVMVWPVGHGLWLTGCAITLAGLVVTLWSRLALGTNWSATVTYREGHTLVARGPYRFVRHPMYTGLTLMICGTAVVVGSVGGLLAVVVFLLGTWWKLKKEEALLARHFPADYPQYRSRTKALIPFVI
jgi:protein-S-isoprenylcysteine O-methyltransferase Ste14